MIGSRGQFGYRGVLVALFATLITYVAFNAADQVLMSQGLDAAFGWSEAGRRGHRGPGGGRRDLGPRLGASRRPWAATNLVDLFVVGRGHYAIADLFTPAGIYGA